MKFIIGVAVVFGAVLGGFMLHHGDPLFLFVPSEYLVLAMRENVYLVAALVLLSTLMAAAVKRLVVPLLAPRPLAFAVAQTAGYSLMIALIFIFLRPISQFIYFQF